MSTELIQNKLSITAQNSHYQFVFNGRYKFLYQEFSTRHHGLVASMYAYDVQTKDEITLMFNPKDKRLLKAEDGNRRKVFTKRVFDDYRHSSKGEAWQYLSDPEDTHTRRNGRLNDNGDLLIESDENVTAVEQKKIYHSFFNEQQWMKVLQGSLAIHLAQLKEKECPDRSARRENIQRIEAVEYINSYFDSNIRDGRDAKPEPKKLTI